MPRQTILKKKVFILYNSFQIVLHMALEVLQMGVFFKMVLLKKIKQKMHSNMFQA